MTRRNLIPNPKVQNNLSSYIADSKALTSFTRETIAPEDLPGAGLPPGVNTVMSCRSENNTEGFRYEFTPEYGKTYWVSTYLLILADSTAQVPTNGLFFRSQRFAYKDTGSLTPYLHFDPEQTTYQRVGYEFTPYDTSTHVIRFGQVGSGVMRWKLTALMMEETEGGDPGDPYGDGDSAGWEWDGAPNASTSRFVEPPPPTATFPPRADVPHFKHPFTITGKGAKTIEQDSDEDLLLNVSTLLRTETGSRDELPEYGVDDLPFRGDVSDEIVEAVRDWEPRVEAEADSDIRDLIQTVDVDVT